TRRAALARAREKQQLIEQLLARGVEASTGTGLERADGAKAVEGVEGVAAAQIVVQALRQRLYRLVAQRLGFGVFGVDVGDALEQLAQVIARRRRVALARRGAVRPLEQHLHVVVRGRRFVDEDRLGLLARRGRRRGDGGCRRWGDDERRRD